MANPIPAAVVAGLLLCACSQEKPPEIAFGQSGVIEDRSLDEVSGLQSGWRNPDVFFVHNDDGPARLSVIDVYGRDLGSFIIEGGANRDWEDITAVPSPGGPLLVVADMGDNFAQWNEIILYFIEEPELPANGKYGGTVELVHKLTLQYPEGARDCESIAYDPSSEQLIFLTKRDSPPRIYAIKLQDALRSSQANLVYLGNSRSFRPPSRGDLRTFGARDGPWVSQPTGMDISRDGTRAAVISYRSLYVFNRGPDESWQEALQRAPIEFEAPPSMKEEAVGFLPDGGHILITTEGIPAPVYRLETPGETP